MKKLEEDPLGVLLVDLMMPETDGMEVLKRAREAYPGEQLAMLTGHGSEADEAEARRMGVFEYFRKPIPIDQLMRTLKAA